MDFFRINTKEVRGGITEVYPDFIVGRAKDLMVQGQAFYAIWDEEAGLWSRDEYDVVRLVDAALYEYAEKLKESGVETTVKPLGSFDTNRWNQFKKFVKNVSDNSSPLDTKVTFANTEVRKRDHASRRLPYAIARGDMPAYNELVGHLYEDEERAKFEWAIGAIIAGEAKRIHKFLLFFGDPGTGKSTVMDIAFAMFGGLVKDGGYVATFDAKALTGNNNAFSTEAFKDNPLLALQHDSDFSKIEDNTKLNSIVSHEVMKVNEKYKATYDTKINAFLMAGTNSPVRITDAKSGLLRRLIDVHPTGNTHRAERYHYLVEKVQFELGAIAHHCLETYQRMGKSYYNGYKPIRMISRTNVFYNFVDAHFDTFRDCEGISLKRAYDLFKAYASETGLEFKLPQYKFRDELKNYFSGYVDRVMIDGVQNYSYFTGFLADKFVTPVAEIANPVKILLEMGETESKLDEILVDQPAQYSNAEGNPLKYWTDEERIIDGELKKPRPNQVVNTVLGDIDTSELHFVKVPENHIVVDFDLKGDDGEKSLERNLEAAAKLPSTYAELSKSGNGVHLHYTYEGDPSELAPEYAEGIEIKVYSGGASLRRKLTKCNNLPVATINSGLPFKEKKMLQSSSIKSEKGLRDLIGRNLRKEIHPGTKPSIDFIKHVLDEAYADPAFSYDVTDLRQPIMLFANNSSNRAMECLKAVAQMKFKSEGASEPVSVPVEPKDERVVFFDCEVYPNLFVVCWKYQGSPTLVKMINPTAQEIEALFRYKLVGFNNRSYDNHILWGRYMGYDNRGLYELSQKLIGKTTSQAAKFGAAYNVSFADAYDFSSDRKGLKKWEIELGLKHMEMDIPWDQDVPEDMIAKVVEYCCNDVEALEAVFDHCKQDWNARLILADLSGLTPNDTTSNHAARIIFGNDRSPQDKFNYTDLSKEFPGYTFDEFAKVDKSLYRGESVGEGGYVYAEPGMYENVALLDVASMHPSSIEALDLFGPYTEKFSAIKAARLALKRKDYPAFQKLLPGAGVPENSEDAKDLSNALKLVINTVYGLTVASFKNPFRDMRNKDNIVAKRGALFMVDLKKMVQEAGYQVIHIKTDSIKIPDATETIIRLVQQFGERYGYEFEHENTYEKFCLVNDAVYIARDENHHWTATGAEFKQPYVFKTLFSGEPVSFKDLCETKSVKSPSVMCLDFDKSVKNPKIEDMRHVGRTGSFVPVNEQIMGGNLYRVQDGKCYAVSGTKGYQWIESEMINTLAPEKIERMKFEDLTEALEGTGSVADIIDLTYFENMAMEARKTIEKFGSFDEFVS